MSNQAYPLSWPVGWPKTEPLRRERGAFKTSLYGALENLRKEVRLLGGKELVLSSNVTLGHERPKDPGVVAYFQWSDLAVAIPCDRWSLVEHNVQAIALTVEAMRGMERWGAKHMIRAMFTGFKALPSSERPWHEVLGLSADCTPEQVASRYRELAKQHHPDAGGSHEEFIRIQQAYTHANAAFSS